MEIRDSDGNWHNVNAKAPPFEFEFAYIKSENWDINSTYGLLATFRHVVLEDRVVVGMNMAVNPDDVAAILSLHFICVEEGVLIRFATEKRREEKAHCWSMPRLLLIPDFDEYLYWDDDDKLHADLFENLGGQYAGVLPEQKGDLSKSLSEAHPTFLVRSQKLSVGLGAVYLDYSSDWKNSQMFLQHQVWFYPGISPFFSDELETWAWLAPFPYDVKGAAEKVERLLIEGEELKSDFSPIAPDFPEEFLEPIPNFPSELRRKAPVEDINEAIVYTLNHTIHSPYAMELVKKVGSDVLVRGWFKGGDAPDYAKDAKFVQQAHRLGTLFGGGTICSQLFYGENNLTEEEWLDMATRGTNGELVKSFGGRCVHGTLSNPKYVDYIIYWSCKQIDAGVDYLFMDEHTAGHHSLIEGYDDYSLRDFGIYLKGTYCSKQGWSEDDIRWKGQFKIDLEDPDMCPDGTINSFNYRVYLQKLGFTKRPWDSDNLLGHEFSEFKEERDDRAWKRVTDELRAYASSKGRRIYISANGIAKYVDIQIVNMGIESAKKYEGQLDLSESFLDKWNSFVRKGWDVAACPVPVVFSQDWGGLGGTPIFAWMELSPSEKDLWIRVRGAEIYASGGFFAFPIWGPFGFDAMRDGTIGEIARQTEFYQRNKLLYLQSKFISSIKTEHPFLSVALWKREKPPALLLHVINRETVEGKLKRQTNVTVDLPVVELPKKITVFSPDFQGTKSGKAVKKGESVNVEIPELEAYALVVLDYKRLPHKIEK